MSQQENNASAKKGIPFSLQIVIAVILAIVVGILLGAGNPPPELIPLINDLKVPTDLFFKALTALAAPLIFLLLLETLIKQKISGKQGLNLLWLILQNTLVAILIGFLVVSILTPGTWVNLDQVREPIVAPAELYFWQIILNFINYLTPETFLQPLVENNFISLVLIALVFGFILRRIKIEQECQGKTNIQSLEKIIKVLSKAIERIFKWVIVMLPIAVFGIVANTVAEQGFAPFISFGALIVAVLLALFLQACYYLIRIKFGSWVNPIQFLFKGFDAFLFPFFTASSALTMPTAYSNLVEKMGVRENSASLGVYLGGNISKDAVPLFLVLFTLFVAQILGLSFTLPEYLIIFLLSMFSSILTIGVPGSSIVMMILLFNTLSLPVEYIGLLLSIYWFIDMCGAVINVMGYMTLAILLDGKERVMN